MNTIKETAKNFTKGLFNPDNKLSLIPNWLSFSRVIGGVAIPIMTYTGTSLPILFGTVSFLAVSDFLDGKAARIIAKGETKEGAMLDAISDKIFSLALIIGILPVMPIFALNGIMETAISLVNTKLLSNGGHPNAAAGGCRRAGSHVQTQHYPAHYFLSVPCGNSYFPVLPRNVQQFDRTYCVINAH